MTFEITRLVVVSGALTLLGFVITVVAVWNVVPADVWGNGPPTFRRTIPSVWHP